LEELNVFETTIQYLGRFLAAYNLSGGIYPGLLQKAYDMGEMLYVAFDTPNRMPVPRWNPKLAMAGTSQISSDNVLVAEIGSLTLEFTRFSQITGDMRFYDAVQRIMDMFGEQQMTTKLPGLWPVVVNGRTGKFNAHFVFTIGGMADSLYEYLPKQHLLLGGATLQYQQMYERALVAMKQSIFLGPWSQETRAYSSQARSILMV
jgi:mannosyl-oligosaccharide alpha-1,2-mannosidase